MRASGCAVVIILIAGGCALADADPSTYARLRGTRYALWPVDVPEGGVEIKQDLASFRLESGEFRPMQPAADTVTGFVFQGKGRFHFDVPNGFELAQLRRFTRDKDITGIDTTFTTLIVRRSSAVTPPFAMSFPEDGYERNGLAYERAEESIKDWDVDIDARVVAGMLIPGDEYFVADLKTKDFGWLRYQFEPWDAEEVTLAKLQAPDTFPEIWVSADRASERDAAGFPTSDVRRLIDVASVDVDADLGNHRGELIIGSIDWVDPDTPAPPRQPLPDPIHIKARVEMQVLVEGMRAIPLELHPWATVSSVRTADGAELGFIRDRVGERYALIRDERAAGSVIVIAEAPLHRGQTLTLEFDYELKTYNYVSGRRWYPGPVDPFNDRHTGRIVVHAPAKFQVRSAGVLESDTVEGNRRTSIWNVTSPTKMMAFSFGTGKEESVKLEGAPEVLVFGGSTGAVFGNMVHNVAVDVARAQKWFQEYFALPAPAPQLRAAAITGWHGQSFEGFLQLSQLTFNEEHPGHTEVFRGHEVAHQYWGHLVGWKGYRDQWLSESFAEYSALMFVQAMFPKEHYFDGIIADFAANQLGSLKGGTIFQLPFTELLQRPDVRADLGPIGAGWRAGTSRVPYGYYVQAYEKGALVLHTLRTALSSASKDQDVFRLVLQDFLREQSGKAATTADFQKLLERRVPYAWGPFFEAYVYGTEIPTFAWKWSTERQEENVFLIVSIEASHVPEGFQLPIPLRIEFPEKSVRYTFVNMEGARKVFRIPIPGVPRDVKLNPNNAVLARIESLVPKIPDRKLDPFAR
ncbi:MAG TPA: M1 family aminopeptidase [Candidatus Polarisedimenticolaceae bacterium]|nr:M1 family aminopeptidase [Candidatus Polarisedimenticolaceae bacterium]